MAQQQPGRQKLAIKSKRNPERAKKFMKELEEQNKRLSNVNWRYILRNKYGYIDSLIAENENTKDEKTNDEISAKRKDFFVKTEKKEEIMNGFFNLLYNTGLKMDGVEDIIKTGKGLFGVEIENLKNQIENNNNNNEIESLKLQLELKEKELHLEKMKNMHLQRFCDNYSGLCDRLSLKFDDYGFKWDELHKIIIEESKYNLEKRLEKTELTDEKLNEILNKHKNDDFDENNLDLDNLEADDNLDLDKEKPNKNDDVIVID